MAAPTKFLINLRPGLPRLPNPPPNPSPPPYRPPTAELLPPKVRSMANSIIICFAFIAGFIVSKTFIDLVESPLKFSGTFWLYGADCIIGALFTAVFVPETRNKSIEEIQAIFRSKGKKGLGEHPGLGHPLDSVT